LRYKTNHSLWIWEYINIYYCHNLCHSPKTKGKKLYYLDMNWNQKYDVIAHKSCSNFLEKQKTKIEAPSVTLCITRRQKQINFLIKRCQAAGDGISILPALWRTYQYYKFSIFKLLERGRGASVDQQFINQHDLIAQSHFQSSTIHTFS